MSEIENFQDLTELSDDVLHQSGIAIVGQVDDIAGVLSFMKLASVSDPRSTVGAEHVNFDVYDFLGVRDTQKEFGSLLGAIELRIPEDNRTQIRRASADYPEIDRWHEDDFSAVLVSVYHGVQYAVNPNAPSHYKVAETQQVPDDHIFTVPDGVITHHGPHARHRRNPLAVKEKRMSVFSAVARHPMLMPHGTQLRLGMEFS